jgi:hypothetical protein
MAVRFEGTDAIQPLVRQLTEGRNWVERRDAATALTLLAREALLALRTVAGDKDPDVAHSGNKGVETIGADLTTDLAALELELSGALRAYRADRGATSLDEGLGAAAAPAATGATQEDIATWLREIADRREGALEAKGTQFTLELKVGGERRQKIYVDTDKADSSGQPVVVTYTLCGAVEPKAYASALRSNTQLSHAAFGLIKREDRNLLVMVNRARLASLTREIFEDDLLYLARKGDRAEAQLQEQDSH